MVPVPEPVPPTPDSQHHTRAWRDRQADKIRKKPGMPPLEEFLRQEAAELEEKRKRFAVAKYATLAI